MSQNTRPYGQPDPFSDHPPRQLGFEEPAHDPFASTATLSTTAPNPEFGGRHQPDYSDDEEEKVPLSQGQGDFAGGFYPPA